MSHLKCLGLELHCSYIFFEVIHKEFGLERKAKIIRIKKTSVHISIDGWRDAQNIHYLDSNLLLLRSN